MIGLAALALALVVPLNMAFAVHDNGLFELGPANPLDPDSEPTNILGDDTLTGPDWAELFTSNGEEVNPVPQLPTNGVVATFIQDGLSVKNQVDQTTFSGSKNNDPVAFWGWTPGNVPAKDDLSNVYLYGALDPETEDLILYAGIERIDPSGDSHIDLEINQVPVDTNGDGTFTGKKSDGDILGQSLITNGSLLKP
jgi:hypothetical protein